MLDLRLPRVWVVVCVLFACGFAFIDCGPATDCDANRPCPNGQTCVSGKCETASDDGGEKVVVTEQTTPDTTPQESLRDLVPTDNQPPKEQSGITVYQWRPATSGIQTDLYGVSMGTDKDVWAVGAGGVILRSSDAGATWSKQTSGVTDDLYTVWFVDGKVGYVGGAGGVMLKTINGGDDWNKLTSPTNEPIRKMQFINDQAGFAVGDGFTLLVTRDGGKTWQPQGQQLDFDLLSLYFTSRFNGYVVGSKGQILYTRDSANKVTSVATGTQISFYDVHFPDESNGWVVGEKGEIRKSEDRGQSWDPKQTGFSETFYDVHFLQLERGWIAGANGTLIGTRDGGKTWFKEVDKAYTDLHSMSIRSTKAGVVVGKKGTILWLKPEAAQCAPGDTRDCYSGPAGTKDVGTCVSGKQTCEGGVWGPCKGEITPEPKEICFNQKDDNCNGKDDQADGCPACQDGDTETCYTGPQGTMGTGACRAGQKTCKNGVFGECEKQILPKAEDCNGLDDDCDGKVDNDIADKDKPACTLFRGICATAKKTCEKGKWVACTTASYGGEYEKTETKCDGKDNDCDGSLDEGCACTKDGDTRKCYNGPKDTVGVGTCKEGDQTCRNGKWTACEKQVRPVTEVCGDKLDNDCDGKTDEKNQYSLFFNSQKRAHVLIKDDAALRPTKGLTLEGHFYPLSLGVRNRPRALISREENGGYGLYLDVPARGDLTFRVWPKGGKSRVDLTVKYQGLVSARKWVHLAGVADGKELRLYVNGKKVGAKAFASEIGYDTKDVPLIFGAEAGFGDIARTAYLFYGNIAQVRIAGEAMYTADFTPDCDLKDDPKAIGFWGIDDASGTTAKDAKGKHDGTLKAATWRESIRCSGFTTGGCREPKP